MAINVDNTADGFINTGTSVAKAANPYTIGPDYRGGYVPGAIGSTGGGYDPNNPSYGNQSNSIGGDVAVSRDFTGAPSFAGGYYGEQTETSGGGYDPSVAGLDDPKNARLATSGLAPGGILGMAKADPSVAFQGVSGPMNQASATENDWRVRISLADNATIFYKDPSNYYNNIMSPLIPTNGVIFPYTPSINVTHTAHYNQVNPTHSNYPLAFYNYSEVNDIQISGEFTVQSVEEGQYLMAVVYFFRAATKMFFGSGANVGNPPPIVFLDGYGSHYFPHVPCVITQFSHDLGNEVDYIQVPITTTTLEDVNITNDNMNLGSVNLTPDEAKNVPSLLRSQAPNQSAQQTRTQFQTIVNNTRVPTNSSIRITLKPVYSRKNLHQRFNLNDFSAGALIADRKRGFGGFI